MGEEEENSNTASGSSTGSTTTTSVEMTVSGSSSGTASPPNTSTSLATARTIAATRGTRTSSNSSSRSDESKKKMESQPIQAQKVLREGLSLIQSNQLEEAENRLINAVSMTDAVGDEIAQAYAFGALGVVYYKTGHKDSGFSFHAKSLEQAQQCIDVDQEASSLLILGALSLELGRKQDAGEYLNEFIAKSPHAKASELAQKWMKRNGLRIVANQRFSESVVSVNPRKTQEEVEEDTAPEDLDEVTVGELMDADVEKHIQQIDRRWKEREESCQTEYLERKFENLYFEDVLKYCESEIEALSRIQELFHTRAAAERKYAQQLESMSNVTSESSKSNVGGLMSALGAAFTTRLPDSSHKTSPMSRDILEPETNCSDTREQAIHRYQSTCRAKAQKRKQAATRFEEWETKLRTTRQKHEETLRRFSKDGKEAVKNISNSIKALSKGRKRLNSSRKELDEAQLHFDAIKSALKNAQAALDDYNSNENRESDPSESRSYQNILDQINTITQEYRKREKPYKQAEAAVEHAEEHVRKLGSELVKHRRNRDQLFYQLAIQLQSSSEERQILIARSMRVFSEVDCSINAEDAYQGQLAWNELRFVNPSSNIRLFVHRAQVKHILHEQTLRIIQDQKAIQRQVEEGRTEHNENPHGVSGRSSKEGGRGEKSMTSRLSSLKQAAVPSIEDNRQQEADSDQRIAMSIHAVPALANTEEDNSMNVIPERLPESTRQFRTEAHINREVEYRPLVKKWISDVFHGTGSETWDVNSNEVQILGSSPDDIPTMNTAPLFRTPAGRALFLRYLNTYRGKQMDVNEHSMSGFDRLVQIMSWFLDACLEQSDVASAKMAMILSETFYTCLNERSEGRRRYIQEGVKAHPIWLRQQFWEEAFYRSVREDAEKVFNRHAATATTLWGTNVGANDSDDESTEGRSAKKSEQHSEGESSSREYSVPQIMPGSEDWGYTYLQILFGNLGSYAMNMVNFGMPLQEAKRTVRRLAKGNHLPASMLNDVLENMDSISPANQWKPTSSSQPPTQEAGSASNRDSEL
eukprot:gb/GECG01015010.1/.p1 GENE.gb/GECG01015010.1/~~gb/GECG01015010.1/.p1  ORF type:complete len:1040 (+),score=163.19 gb/GECG01015010.1/:1-3120(+)